MRLLPLCCAAVAARKAQDRWCPPPKLPPRSNQNISIITEFHSKVTPSDNFNLRAHNTGGVKTMGFRYTATALARFAYWHLVVAGFSDVHVVVTHLREDLEPLAEFMKMKCVAAWRDAGRLTFSTEAVRRRSCRDRQLECRKVRAIRNAYLRLRARNTWIAYGDVDELFYTEDGRSISAEMATYEDAVRSVCIPTYVYHDVKERDLPSIRSRAYSGYGYIKEANGGQGECWKSIHRTSHIDRPGLHEAESNDTMARDKSWRVSCVLFVFATSAAMACCLFEGLMTQQPRETYYRIVRHRRDQTRQRCARRRARAMRRGRSRIAHLRHDEYPEKFPDATVSDDVLGRLEKAALLRLKALGTRRKGAPFV